MNTTIINRNYRLTSIACEGMIRISNVIANDALSHVVNNDIAGTGISQVDIPDLKEELIHVLRMTIKQLKTT